MSKIGAYIILHLKLHWGRDAKADRKGQFVTFLIGLVACVALLFILKYFFDVLFNQFSQSIKPEDVSAIVFIVLQLVLMFACISMQIKYLLKPFDITITARFPMSSYQMFFAEIITIYLYIQFMAVALYLPVMIMFGWSANLLSGVFVLRVLLSTFFAPMIPFAFATILSVPTMLIITLLEYHNYIKLGIFIIGLCASFTLYSYVLDFLAEYYIHQRLNANTLSAWTSVITSLNSKWNITIYQKYIVFFDGAWKGIGLTLLIFAAASVVGLLLAKPLYDRVHYKALSGEMSIYSKKTKLNSDNAFIAICKKEFVGIIRNQTYAYFYLGIAITTPVMVFLCDRLVKKVGEAQLGGNISFGISLLVILVFIAMLNSFSASAISREDKAFYITKMTPLSFKSQLLAKALLIFCVSAGALLMSSIILLVLKFVTPLQTLIIDLTGAVMAVGLVFNGLNINLRHPNLGSKANGENNLT